MSGPLRLLLLAPGTSYRPRRYLEAARTLDVELVIGTDMPGAMRHLGCKVLELQLGRPRVAAQEVAKAPFDIHGALGADDATAVVAAHVTSLLGLSGNLPESIEATHDKRQLRERLALHAVAQPQHQLAVDGRLPAHVEFPCVVKPCFLSGSQGVIRANDRDELTHACSVIERILHQHPKRGTLGFDDLLIEHYVEGPEVALEGMLHAGRLETLALFDKPDSLEGPYFEETLYVTPSRLPAEIQKRLQALVQQATQALDLRTGPIHAELRLGTRRAAEPDAAIDSDAIIEPCIIEVAARSIGGLCAKAVELFSGNLEQRLVAQAVGLPAPGASGMAPASGVMMIPIPRTGTLTGFRGAEAARAVPGVVGVEISARPGDRVIELPHGASYLGFIFAADEEPRRVEAALRAAHQKLHFDIAPALPLI